MLTRNRGRAPVYRHPAEPIPPTLCPGCILPSMQTYDPREHVRELWAQNRYFRDLLVALHLESPLSRGCERAWRSSCPVRAKAERQRGRLLAPVIVEGVPMNSFQPSEPSQE